MKLIRIYLIFALLVTAFTAYSATRGWRWINFMTSSTWTHSEPGVHHK